MNSPAVQPLINMSQAQREAWTTLAADCPEPRRVLRALLAYHGVTARSVGRAIGVDGTMISKIGAGVSLPPARLRQLREIGVPASILDRVTDGSVVFGANESAYD